jgi:hypothetical protein
VRIPLHLFIPIRRSVGYTTHTALVKPSEQASIHDGGEEGRVWCVAHRGESLERLVFHSGVLHGSALLKDNDPSAATSKQIRWKQTCENDLCPAADLVVSWREMFFIVSTCPPARVRRESSICMLWHSGV